MSDLPVVPDIDPAVALWLGFVAPTLYSNGEAVDPLTTDDVNNAAFMAVDYTPLCLPPNQQAEGQAYYAAHLLTLRINVLTGDGPGGASANGVVSMEKEGDLQRIFALSQAAQLGDGGTGYYDRWNALWIRCRPAKIGAVLTGYGRRVPPTIDWANNPELWVWGQWPFSFPTQLP